MKKGIFTLLATLPLHAQQPEVQKVEVLPSGESRLEISAADSFALESSTDLASSSWSLLGDLVPVPMAGNLWQIDSANDNAPRRFFRAMPLPALEIAATTVEGGDLSVSIRDTNGPRNYFGLLNYEISFFGAPGQAPLNGQIFVNGSSFTISLPNLNDDSADFARSLTLILTSPDGNSLGRLTVGDSQIRTVPVTDNDASWVGIMIDSSDQSELPLHLFITDEAEASLETTDASFLPANATPGTDGSWPSSFFVASEEVFDVSFGPIPVPAEESSFLPLTELTLQLNATGENITSNTISGTFNLTTVAPSSPHLTFATRTGEFTLRKAVAVPPEATELTDAE